MQTIGCQKVKCELENITLNRTCKGEHKLFHYATDVPSQIVNSSVALTRLRFNPLLNLPAIFVEDGILL